MVSRLIYIFAIVLIIVHVVVFWDSATIKSIRSRHRYEKSDDEEDDEVDDTNDSISRNQSYIPPVGVILQFRLFDANTDLPIQYLYNDTVINLYTQPTQNFNIKAHKNGTVASVLLIYNSSVANFSVADSNPPFSLCGEVTQEPIRDYKACSVLGVGRHTITTIPYQKANLTGRMGKPYQVTFNIVNERVTPRPCNVPKVRNTVVFVPRNYIFW
jgi:hypothetical protein